MQGPQNIRSVRSAVVEFLSVPGFDIRQKSMQYQWIERGMQTKFRIQAIMDNEMLKCSPRKLLLIHAVLLECGGASDEHIPKHRQRMALGSLLERKDVVLPTVNRGQQQV